MSSEKRLKDSHDGHRARCKKRLLSDGCAGMTDEELLEMLLFYAVPRKDVRPQADALIKRFGSIENVINAENEEVAEITGFSRGVELLMMLLRETVARTRVIEGDSTLLDGDKIKDYLLEIYKGKEVEVVYALYFACDGSYLGKQAIFRGDVSSARFSLRTITEGVIRVGGNSVVIAHNHPSGSLVPSNDDIISTKRIATHLSANEITLIEHYIVGKDDVVGIYKEQ